MKKIITLLSAFVILYNISLAQEVTEDSYKKAVDYLNCKCMEVSLNEDTNGKTFNRITNQCREIDNKSMNEFIQKDEIPQLTKKLFENIDQFKNETNHSLTKDSAIEFLSNKIFERDELKAFVNNHSDDIKRLKNELKSYFQNLIKTDYPWFLDTYNQYENKINRIDIVRYFILDKYGGIYADMDYICIKNFYNELPTNKVSISESPYKENEIIQNALMCSPKKHSFWMKVITEGKKRWDNNDNRNSVLYIAGPQLVSKVYEDNKDDVNVLPFDKYNPKKNTDEFNNDDNLFTKHFFTNTWT